MQEPEPLYYESHITIDPVFDERLEQFKKVCRQFKFRPAKLLMQKSKNDIPELNKNDSFCTGRSKTYADIFIRMHDLVNVLKENKFVVRRFKIESVVFDTKEIENGKSNSL